MTDPALLERAAVCYLTSGLPGEAARCLREAGAYRRSAQLWEELGRFAEAAEDYARGGQIEPAAWLLVHRLGDTEAARTLLVQGVPSRPTRFGRRRLVEAVVPPPRPESLRAQLALARCDVADGLPDRRPLAALSAAADRLAAAGTPHDRLVEDWSVAVAEVMGRYDQVALVYAAAVRGRRGGAAERWTQWSARVLGAEITIPDPPPPTPPPRREQPRPVAFPGEWKRWAEGHLGDGSDGGTR